MQYSGLELLAFFFIYSFIGWCGEVVAAALHRKKFVNRGFINGILCPIYGLAAVFCAIFLPELKDNVVILFMGGVILTTVLEYITGRIMENLFHKKLWDYSQKKFNLDGYICLQYALLWGVLTVVSVKFVNDIIVSGLEHIPYTVQLIVIIVLMVITFLDFASTAMAVWGMQSQAKYLADFPLKIKKRVKPIENALTRVVQRRMQHSFPSIDMNAIVEDWKEKKELQATTKEHFAEGCGFYKLFSLFFIGAFLGDIVETIYCYFTAGYLMSRSSVVYGPFSIVWGLGCALLTYLLYRYKDKSDRYIFMAGTFLGGAYEYICSVFTELVFGTVFWDYSGFAFNLGGRINLLYCFFWGIAAVVWLKMIYPFLSKKIESLPKRAATIVCNCLVVFMAYNMIISSLALARYTERNTVEEASTIEVVAKDETPEKFFPQWLNTYLDEHFDNERMERIYPNAKIVVE